jgi:cytochrome c oxidase cbb3-type subunit 3
MPRVIETLRTPLALAALGLLAFHRARTTPAAHAQASRPGTQPTYFVEHPEHIQLGMPAHPRWAALSNPYANDPARASEGARLFVAYNCLDCHGADGAGAMGPSLQDGRWHFGGTAGEIFQSIYEGRPDGMPSWGGRIDDSQIWRLVAYVQTLSKGRDVTSEHFTGKTVARSGH